MYNEFEQNGLCPNPHTFFLDKKKYANVTSRFYGKNQDCVCFTRKTCVQLAETVQTRSFVAQTGQFLTPTSLVFRFTRQGRSLEEQLYN